MSRAGVHYTRCSSGAEIHLVDAAGADTMVAPGDFSGPECARCDRLAVSPDGSTILVQQRTGGADLVMIENFR